MKCKLYMRVVVGIGAEQSAGACFTNIVHRRSIGHEQDIDSTVGDCAQPVDRFITLNNNPLVRRPDVYVTANESHSEASEAQGSQEKVVAHRTCCMGLASSAPLAETRKSRGRQRSLPDLSP